MFTIKINFEKNGTNPQTLRNIRNGQTILEICLKHNIDLEHNCGGVCACSTCHVYVLKGSEFMEDMSVREKHFIAKNTNAKSSSRLACQCLLVSAKGEVELVIP